MHMCIKRTHANDLHGKKSHCGKEEEVLEVVFLSSMHIYLYAFPARNSAVVAAADSTRRKEADFGLLLGLLHAPPPRLPAHNVIFSTCMDGYIRSSSLHTLTVNM